MPKNSRIDSNGSLARDEVNLESTTGGKDDATKNNPANQAQRKEEQPGRSGDLSSLHNTHEVGTSGGDQRVPDREVPETDQGIKKDVPGKPIPVKEPGEGAPPAKEYDEPEKDPPINANDK